MLAKHISIPVSHVVSVQVWLCACVNVNFCQDVDKTNCPVLTIIFPPHSPGETKSLASYCLGLFVLWWVA